MVRPDVALALDGVTKTLGGRIILRDVDLQIAAGEALALMGANGAGKSTLLRIMATATQPTTGAVRWFGEPAGKSPEARRLIGFVAHQSFLYPHLTGEENLLFAARMHGIARPRARAAALLEQAGLSHHARRLTCRLSHGMRRRLAILRTLVHDPPILLLDEPFSGLDVLGSQWLTQLLATRRRGPQCLCFTTHDLHTVRQVADRVVVLERGCPRALNEVPQVWPSRQVPESRAA